VKVGRGVSGVTGRGTGGGGHCGHHLGEDSPKLLKVHFHHHIFPTNLMTNSLTKSPHKQMSHIFVLFVIQKFVANQIGLLKTH
jgi:hypothetical protein